MASTCFKAYSGTLGIIFPEIFDADSNPMDGNSLDSMLTDGRQLRSCRGRNWLRRRKWSRARSC